MIKECSHVPRGEAVEVLHYFGDALWEATCRHDAGLGISEEARMQAMGSPRPDGFVGQRPVLRPDLSELAWMSGAEIQPTEAEAVPGRWQHCDCNIPELLRTPETRPQPQQLQHQKRSCLSRLSGLQMRQGPQSSPRQLSQTLLQPFWLEPFSCVAQQALSGRSLAAPVPSKGRIAPER